MASESSVKRPIHHHVRLNAFSLDPDALPALVCRHRQDEPIVVAYFESGTRSQAAWCLCADDGGQSVLLGKLGQHFCRTCGMLVHQDAHSPMESLGAQTFGLKHNG